MPRPLTIWPGLAAVTAAGLVVRAIPLALSDFPVNDGGLFMAMTRAIQDAGWALPTTVAWNGTDLPFTYPPLAFYKVGLLNSAFGLDLFDVFRWFPLLTSVLIVPAVYLLARELLRSELGGLVAALAYALAPSSYVWMIQGGGVTRSPGLLVAIVALWQVVVLVRRPTRGRMVGVGLLAGLTALIHPGAAVFLALSAVLVWVFEGRTQPAFAHAAGAAGIGLLLLAPWLVVVASRHGIGAVLDVPSNGPEPVAAVLAVLAGRYTGLPFLDPLAVIGLALGIVAVVRRRFLLPLWFVAGIAMSYQYAMVPWAILIGTGAVDLAARATAAGPAAARPSSGEAAPRQAGWLRSVPLIGSVALAASFLVAGTASALTVLNPGAPVHALSPERRVAAAWVADNLEPGARLAVITNSVWNSDSDSEWFPQLAGRVSVATVQGSEWLGSPAFQAQVQAHQRLQGCVQPASVSCVQEWLAEWPADYLYLPKGPLHGQNSPGDCCAALREGLQADPAYMPVYDDLGATIFRVGLRSAADQGSSITVAPGPS